MLGAENLYATLADVKADLGLSVTTEDDELIGYIEAVSRAIDTFCLRHFYVAVESRFQTADRVDRLMLDSDLLSVTALTTDCELDGTYDGETWTEDTDFYLSPYNSWPKLSIETTGFGSYGFSTRRRNVKITGEWGYGNGKSATPYAASGITGTVATSTGTTLTLSADGTIKSGHTIRIGTEQMYVSALSTGTATVTRGVNGTTAAAHSAAAISVYLYPKDVVRLATWLSVTEYRQRTLAGFSQEKIGDYFYTRMKDEGIQAQVNVLAPYQRTRAA